MANKLFALLLSGVVAMILVIAYFGARAPQLDGAISSSRIGKGAL